jgi:NADH-quinone oxidoreductase subunit C
MDNQTLLAQIQAAFPSTITEIDERHGDLKLRIPRESLLAVAQWLRDHAELQYTFLESVTGVDYLGREPRFEVVYHLFSFRHFHRLCLKVGAPEADPVVPSLTGLFPTANWQEREAYDLLGIEFSGHPALQRILMPDDWIGHPLRKDVPLGYEEVAFTFNQDRIYAHKPFAKE